MKRNEKQKTQLQTYFSKAWLDEEDFKKWLSPVADNTQARCKQCNKTFNLSNMGRQALVSHAAGKKHITLTHRSQTFFQRKTAVPSTEESEVSEPSTDADRPSCSKQVVEIAFNNTDKIKAEIYWVLKCITGGYSNNSCNNIAILFQNMFPDSEIAKKFQLGPNKVKYLTNFGIKPYIKDLLVESIKKSNCYIVSFDESLNKVTQNCEMDLLLRFFDPLDERVKVRFFDSRFLGHATHSDLLQHFNDAVKDLNPNHMYQISMDGPSVNLKFYDCIIKQREENEQHALVNIGTCGLHTIHGAFRNGAQKSDWNIKKVLKGSYILLHDSPARRDDYQSVTGSEKFPLQFCVTR